METIKLKKRIKSDGKLLIDYQTSFSDKDIEVLLIINEVEKQEKANFSNLIGGLEWVRNAVLAQKQIRKEWE